MREFSIFTRAGSLNTVDDPVDLPFKKGGECDLSVAVNIDIGRTGRTSRREAVNLVKAGSYNSLFSCRAGCFVVSGTTLYQITQVVPVVEAVPVFTGLTPGFRVSYADVDGTVYFQNTVQAGKVKDLTYSQWVKGTYAGPDTTRVFNGPVIGSHIAFFSGRMYVSQGKVLWWSELYRPDLFDMARSFGQFESAIRMVRPVEGGIYVSTEKETIWLNGKAPESFTPITVANFPAVEWTDESQFVEALDIGFRNPGLCAMWASPEGAMIGTPSGTVINVTKRKIIYPPAAKEGFGCLVGYNFIHGMR